MPNPTLMDIAVANGSDPVVGLIEESIKAHPEMQRAYARTIKGINYKTLVRTELPTVAFRNVNEGSATVKSRYENRLVECFTLNPIWNADQAAADAYEDGAPAFIAMEGVGMVEAAIRTLCKQFYYGNAATGLGDAKGNPGLIDAYDATNFVVDATGTTASTGSSVWAVRFGLQDVCMVWGNKGDLALSDVVTQQILDGSNNPYMAYIQSLLARPGLQVGKIQSVGRIKKLTADSGKGLTDSLISQLIEKFPVGHKPDVLFMSRRSHGQLQRSRTATNPTGQPAPFPTEAFGIPIEVTDSILDTEPLTL
jgi:hypothetical protein